MNKISYYWAGVVGLFSVVWQILSYYLRFGKMNEFATFIEYLAFFGAGTLGGLILIFFLNLQTSSKGWWAVMYALPLRGTRRIRNSDCNDFYARRRDVGLSWHFDIAIDSVGISHMVRVNCRQVSFEAVN